MAETLATSIALDFPPKSRIAFNCRDDACSAVAVLGILMADCLPLPLRSDFPQTLSERIAQNCGAMIVPAAEQVAEIAFAGLPPVAMLAPARLQGGLRKIASGRLLCTSGGSSSIPKVLVHSVQRVIDNARAHMSSVGLENGSILLTPLPFAFSFQYLTLFLGALASSSVLCLVGIGSTRELIPLIASLRPDAINFSPYLFRSFVRRHGVETLGGVKVISVGGARVETYDMEQLRLLDMKGHRCFVTYGATECGPRIATGRIGSDIHGPGFVGRPIDGVEVRIESQSHRILVRTPHLAFGYCEAGQDTPRPLIQGSGWFETEDLGRLDPGGNLYVEGRADRLLYYRGAKISPEAVETVLLEHPHVESVLIKLGRVGGVEHLLGYVQARPGAVAPQDLRDFAAERLPKAWIPTQLSLVADGLVSEAGKLRYASFGEGS